MISSELIAHENRRTLDKATTAALEKAALRGHVPTSVADKVDSVNAAKDEFFKKIFEEKGYKEGITFISNLAVEDSAETKIMQWYLSGGSYYSLYSPWFGKELGDAIKDEAQEIMKVVKGLQRS